MDLSVVVPTHNNLPVLKQCVASWRRVDCVEHELLIIEDGCTDGTPQWLEEIADGRAIRWFHENDVYETLSDIRGMKEARGRYVLIWQDDMFLRRPWLVEESLAAMDATPELGVLGLMRGNRYRPLRFRPSCHDDFYDARHRRRDTYGGLWRAHEVDACVRPWMVRKACVEELGVLDEAFAPLHWDEMDYHTRLRAAGWKVAVLPYEILGAYTHLGAATTSSLDSQWHEKVFVKNGLRFYDRWAKFIEKRYTQPYGKWRRISSFPLPRGWSRWLRFVLWRRVLEPLYPAWGPIYRVSYGPWKQRRRRQAQKTPSSV